MSLFLDLVTKYVQLRKQGPHMVGPCPKCGGSQTSTRFVVHLAKDFGNCYSCGFNADPVRLLREMEGMKCHEAHRTVGIDCDRTKCPVADRCPLGRGEASSRRDYRSTPQIRQQHRQEYTQSVADNPVAAWQHHAMEMVTASHERLLACPEQLDYLASRGLPLDAVIKHRLGWIPKVEFKTRKAWGLEDKWHEKEQRPITALAFQQGILIPWIIDGHIHRLRLRKATVRDKDDPRYLWIDGSGTDIICLNPTAKAHCVVESDLDGLLIDWLAGDLVGAVPLGSCSTKPKATVMSLLKESLRILVTLDFDGEIRDGKIHAPGAKASRWWFDTFPDTARRWPVPQGKDPGEAFAAGVDLRAWVVAGLPPTLQHIATRPAKQPAPVVVYPTKARAREVAEQLQPQTPTVPVQLEIRQTRSGRHIVIWHSATVPQHVHDEAASHGLAVYTINEIVKLRDLAPTPDQADLITDVKELWPGAMVI